MRKVPAKKVEPIPMKHGGDILIAVAAIGQDSGESLKIEGQPMYLSR